MSAFTKLAQFNKQLPQEQGVELLTLIHAYVLESESEKLQLMEQYERIIRAMQDKPKYEVVAIAGTAETLLSNPLNSVEGC
jgi:hypothetical protein